ncbi:MAG: beta-N-acetylhexosaminidase [Pseudomonadota bacterium]
MPKAVFFGLSGLALTPQEQAFFRAVRPAGYILFARNIESRAQVRDLTSSLNALAHVDPLPILIDQEGGRVRRLRPPLALEHPPVLPLGQLYDRDPAAACEAARLHGAAIGAELFVLGITVDCLPVLDLLFEETHAIIGDRAFSRDPAVVAALGKAVMEGLGESSVVPVIKHIPGHGRAKADSHLELPVVDAPIDALSDTDFAPFAALSSAPMAMTAHILYSALDPNACATHSPGIVGDIIRKQIGFDGLLMTDDLSMKALGGDMGERAQRSIDAGCDIILHCNGDMAEMEAVAEAAPTLAGQPLERLSGAMAWPQRGENAPDVAACVAKRDSLLGGLA